MTMFGFTKAALAVAVLASSAAGQTSFFEAPKQAWAKGFAPMSNNNGLVLNADDSILFATSATGGVAAMKRDDGSIIWSNLTETGFSNGEVTFSPDGETIYYPVSTGETCTVYAKTAATGADVWASQELAGVCEGSVQVTSDGENVFVIYNSDTGTIGHFTVLDNTGMGIYTYDDAIGPFSPMGFYGEPSPGGNYPAGTGNTNSFAIWGYTPTPTATAGEVGGSFGFQMPVATSLAGPNVTTLIPYEATDWRATAPPLLTSMGQQMFWCVSRSKLRSWTAVSFNQNADGGFEFGRGLPAYSGASYTPAVDNIDTPTLVCGGAANNSFSCMEPTGDPYAFTWAVTTKAPIQANPFFSTEADRVYFVDSAGDWFAVDPSSGEVFWTAPTGVSIEANAAMTSDGAYIFFGDSTGNIVSWQIAESTLGDVTIPDAPGGDGEESVFPGGPESSAPSPAPMPSDSSETPSAPTAPTSAPASAPASGVVGMSVFSAIAASAVAAVTLF